MVYKAVAVIWNFWRRGTEGGTDVLEDVPAGLKNPKKCPQKNAEIYISWECSSARLPWDRTVVNKSDGCVKSITSPTVILSFIYILDVLSKLYISTLFNSELSTKKL